MDLYEQLGMRRIVNARATITSIGGSLMREETLDAMRDAAKSFVSVPEFQRKAGAYIARMTNNEAAYICNGAASGLALATAACIAGGDPEKSLRLPRTEGMPNEVLLYRNGHSPYEHVIGVVGGKLVEYGDDACATEAQLEAAISERTCAICVFYYEHRMGNQIPIERQVAIAKKHNLPIIMDAAAQIPPKSNLWRFSRDMGVNIVIFSGGKGLRGPQSSGLIIAKQAMVDRIAEITCPNIGVGRPMKVGKEEIAGLTKAVELVMRQDEQAMLDDYEAQVRAVIDAMPDRFEAVRDFPSEAGQPMPRARLTFQGRAREIADRLENGEPSIAVAADDDYIYINPQTLLPGEIGIVISGILAVADANGA